VIGAVAIMAALVVLSLALASVGMWADGLWVWPSISARAAWTAALFALALTLFASAALAAEPTPLDAPSVATSSCATVRKAWALQRDTAVKWRGIAEKRAETVAGLAADLAETRAELARAHARLVESPPPAPPVRSAILDVLLPAVGAALGGGGAALACSEGRCSTVGTALATAGSAALLAGFGAWIAGLSP